MSMRSIAALCASAIAYTGCVTEGGLALEPASREEQAQANLDLGVGYLREERPDIAIEALQRALEIDPRNADANSVIAIAYDQTGDDELAEAHHRRATALAPANPVPQNAYAVYLCRRDRWADAEPYFRRAIDESGNAGYSYMLNAATCARSAGEHGSAETFCQAALGLEPASSDALRCLVGALIQQADYLRARAYWQRLEQAVPLQPDDLLSCYLIEEGNGDSQMASSCANRLRQEFPTSAAERQLRQIERNGP